MARDSLEVLVGTGTLYLAPIGTAFPANPTVTPSAPLEDVGYSEEGWTFVADRTLENVEVAEEVDPLRRLKTAQSLSIRGAAAQASLENLQLALGGGTITPNDPAAGFRRYTPPSSSAFDEYVALFRVEAPPGDGTKFRDIRCPRVVSVAAVEMSHAKAPQKTLIAMEFGLLVPSVGDIFDVIEQV